MNEKIKGLDGMVLPASEWKLCYIEPHSFPHVVEAYFISDLDRACGDDWNDAPFEHNASRPYGPSRHFFADGRVEKQKSDWNKDGTPKFDLLRVTFIAKTDERAFLALPCSGMTNSEWSVDDINQGEIPWLTGKRLTSEQIKSNPWTEGTPFSIKTGCSLDKFIKETGFAYVITE